MRWQVKDRVFIDGGIGTVVAIIDEDRLYVMLDTGQATSGTHEIDVREDYIKPYSNIGLYKKGDLVRVIRSLESSTDKYIGKIGKVYSAQEMFTHYPYHVIFEGDSAIDGLFSSGVGFSDIELRPSGMRSAKIVTTPRNKRGNHV